MTPAHVPAATQTIPASAVQLSLPATSTALLSDDGQYRYHLSRALPGGAGRPVHFAMFNPSIATAVADDPTLRRCLSFARALNGSSVHVWNLFARISTVPAELPRDDRAIGPDNAAAIRSALTAAQVHSALVIAAWGALAHPLKEQQVDLVCAAAAERGVVLHALRQTRDGSPGHPGRLPNHLRPRPWRRPPASPTRPRQQES